MSIELPGATPGDINLLTEIGISRVGQLRSEDPQSLWTKIATTNETLHKVPATPHPKVVGVWVSVEGSSAELLAPSESRRWEERPWRTFDDDTELPGPPGTPNPPDEEDELEQQRNR